MKLRPFGLVIVTLSAGVLAQTSPAPTIAKPPLATHSCIKPAMPDASKTFSTAEANAILRTLETFRNCVQVFSEGQKQIAAAKQSEAESLRASALQAAQAASAAAAAADAAAKDYNEFSGQAVKIITPKEPAATKQTAPEPAAPRPTRGY